MTAAPQSQPNQTGPILARTVMTQNVISVRPDTPTADIANLLLQSRVSAVPVVDSDNVPIGMVSEGDLIGRSENERMTRTDWWLTLATGARPLDDAFQAQLLAPGRTARDVMSAPLVTVTEDTGVSEIARLFAIHHIKRVPVVRDGRIVGIVSRANLLRVIAAATPPPARSAPETHPGFLASLFGEYHLPAWETVAGIQAAETAGKPAVSDAGRARAAGADSGGPGSTGPGSTGPGSTGPDSAGPDANRIAARDFQALVDDFHHHEAENKEDVRRLAAQHRRERARQLIDAHIFDEGWHQLLHHAREAAEAGQTEVALMRFPNQLCLDAGRAVNVAEPDWPTTLRGRPAEIYLRWERELKPQGFTLSARVLDYPDGKPGDIGLFLVWAAGTAGVRPTAAAEPAKHAPVRRQRPEPLTHNPLSLGTGATQ